MRVGGIWTCGLLVVLMVFNAGCPLGLAPPNSLDNLDALEDADGDGFKDLLGPENVEETVAVAVVNEISRDDALAAAEQFVPNISPELLNLVTVTVNFTVTRIYEDGEEFVDVGSRSLKPFEIMIEAACPQQVVAVVDVTATAPLFPAFEVLPPQEVTFNLSEDGAANSFLCGQVVSVTAQLDEASNLPDIAVSVEDQAL